MTKKTFSASQIVHQESFLKLKYFMTIFDKCMEFRRLGLSFTFTCFTIHIIAYNDI